MCSLGTTGVVSPDLCFTEGSWLRVVGCVAAGAELVQTAPTGASMRVTRRVQWTSNAIAIGVKLVVVSVCAVCSMG